MELENECSFKPLLKVFYYIKLQYKLYLSILKTFLTAAAPIEIFFMITSLKSLRATYFLYYSIIFSEGEGSACVFVCSLCILWFWMWVWNWSILSVQHWGRGITGSRSNGAVIIVMEILPQTLFNRLVVIGVARSPSSVTPKGEFKWWGNTEGQTWKGGQSYQTCSGFPLSILFPRGKQKAARTPGRGTFCKCLRQ